MDGTAYVGADAAHAGDAGDSKAVITPMDRGDAVKLMRVQDWANASTEASASGYIVIVCTQVRNMPHR